MPAFTDADAEGEPDAWTPAERSLLDAALEFYGAAEAVIDYGGPERPRLRTDAGKLNAVRSAMVVLEGHIRVAHDAGVAPDRIARITRLEDEIVALVLDDHRGETEPGPGRAADPTGG
jgi:hypothetical protein